MRLMRNVMDRMPDLLLVVVLAGGLACNGGGNSGGGGGGGNKVTIPLAPTGITATAGNGKVTVSWNSASGATSYNLYWSTKSGVSKANGTKIAGVQSPYDHKGLANGTTYFYVVTAVNSAGESVESTGASARPADFGAAMTDASGQVTLKILDHDFTFKFIDEVALTPIQNLAVGYGLDPASNAIGMLMILDPSKKFYPYFITLEGAPASTEGASASAPLQGILSRHRAHIPAARSLDDSNIIDIFLPDQPQTPIGKFITKYLPPVAKEADKVLGWVDAGLLAAKAIDVVTGGSIGDYAGKLGKAEEKYLTREEAKAEMIADAKQDAAMQIGFYMSGTDLPTNLPSTLISLGKLAAGPLLDYASIVNCGLPGEKIRVMKVGNVFSSYSCRTCQLGDTTGLVRAAVDGVDQYGLPLTTGSLELFSKANIGVGFQTALDKDGGASMEVPIDDYSAVVRSPGFIPSTRDVSVGVHGASLKLTLQPPPALPGDLYIGPFNGPLILTADCAQLKADIYATVTMTVSGSGTSVDPYLGSMRVEGTDEPSFVYCTCGLGPACDPGVTEAFNCTGAVSGSQGKVEASASNGFFMASFTDGTISGNILVGTLTFTYEFEGAVPDAPLIRTVTLMK